MIHSSAVVLCPVPDSADIGPGAVVGERVTVGERVVIGPNAVVEGATTLCDDVKVGPCAVLGTIPQDLKFKGEDTTLVVGQRTVIREFANLNLGTAVSGSTEVGADCFIMAYVHIAHDCRIGDGVILANAVNLAGHVSVGKHAIIGGVVPVHQFARIGEFAMIGGGFRVPKDVPPFVLAGGEPLRPAGVNILGLQRHGWSPDLIEQAKEAFRYFFRSPGVMKEKVEISLSSWPEESPMYRMGRFIQTSERGVIV
jgi:UDP-N-acetylglucosamine acyltransferase